MWRLPNWERSNVGDGFGASVIDYLPRYGHVARITCTFAHGPILYQQTQQSFRRRSWIISEPSIASVSTSCQQHRCHCVKVRLFEERIHWNATSSQKLTLSVPLVAFPSFTFFSNAELRFVRYKKRFVLEWRFGNHRVIQRADILTRKWRISNNLRISLEFGGVNERFSQNSSTKLKFSCNFAIVFLHLLWHWFIKSTTVFRTWKITSLAIRRNRHNQLVFFLRLENWIQKSKKGWNIWFAGRSGNRVASRSGPPEEYSYATENWTHHSSFSRLMPIYHSIIINLSR